MLWNEVISAMSRGCDLIGGNWFDWSSIFNGEVAGSVTRETPADCMLPGNMKHFIVFHGSLRQFFYSVKEASWMVFTDFYHPCLILDLFLAN